MKGLLRALQGADLPPFFPGLMLVQAEPVWLRLHLSIDLFKHALSIQ